jgi:hypothetical protein
MGPKNIEDILKVPEDQDTRMQDNSKYGSR